MALKVKFLQDTQAAYDALEVKDATTFYRTTDELNLYLGTVKLSNVNDLTEALSELGSLDDLLTTSKDDLVSAINEIFLAVESGNSSSLPDPSDLEDGTFLVTQNGEWVLLWIGLEDITEEEF